MIESLYLADLVIFHLTVIKGRILLHLYQSK